MSALEEYNAARVGMPTSIQTVVNQRKADAAINELLAEVEQWKEKERVLVRNRVEWQQRAEAAEAEVDRLAWMLHREWQLRTDDHDVGTFDDWLADLAARYEKEHG